MAYFTQQQFFDELNDSDDGELEEMKQTSNASIFVDRGDETFGQRYHGAHDIEEHMRKASTAHPQPASGRQPTSGATQTSSVTRHPATDQQDASRVPSTYAEARSPSSAPEEVSDARPGPNAFAQQAARVEHHHFMGNAFYQKSVLDAQQKEVQRKIIQNFERPPPTDIHPALRTPGPTKLGTSSVPATLAASVSPYTPMDTGPSGRSSTPVTARPSIDTQHVIPGVSSSHDCQRVDTDRLTEKQRILRAQEIEQPLKLVPSNSHLAIPTLRGRIEERQEQLLQERLHYHDAQNEGSSSSLFPSPLIANETLVTSAATPTTSGQRTGKVITTGSTVAGVPKTSKRSFLERLKKPGSMLSTSSLPTFGRPTTASSNEVSKIPVKAQAVLGAPSTPKKNRISLGGSPLKSQGRLSFDPSPPKPAVARTPSKRAGLFTRKHPTPLEISEPLRSEAEVKEIWNKIGMTPPTLIPRDPNDPRYEIALRSANKEQTKQVVTRSQSLKHFDHAAPPPPPPKNTPPGARAKHLAVLANESTNALASSAERRSPSKFAPPQQREMPSLVTRPSMYSLHASVDPAQMEASIVQEMKSRMDGLDLEGFTTPAETLRKDSEHTKYPQCLYFSDVARMPRYTGPNLSPTKTDTSSISNNQSYASKDSQRTIGVHYPGLEEDPAFQYGQGKGKVNEATNFGDPYISRFDSLGQDATAHGQEETLPTSKNGPLHKTDFESPSSFSDPSAAPSPLQTLPSSSYNPPPIPRKSSKRQKSPYQQVSGRLNLDGTADSPFPIRTSSRNHYLSANRSPASGLQQQASDNILSVRSKLVSHLVDDSTNYPVTAISLAHLGQTTSTDRLDSMLDTIQRLEGRHNEMRAMRAEAYNNNARLDERITAAESLAHSSASTQHTKIFGHIDNPHTSAKGKRVLTHVAQNFYRQANAATAAAAAAAKDSAGEASSDTAVPTPTTRREFEAMERLYETNLELMDIVRDLDKKVKDLERRFE